MAVIGIAEGDAGIAVVGYHHHGGIAVLFGEFNRLPDSVVELDELGNGLHGVFRVGAVVHLAAFDHEEEAVRVFAEDVDGLGCHLAEGGLGGVVAVDFELHVVFVEHGPELVAVEGAEAFHVIFQEGGPAFADGLAHVVVEDVVATSEHHVKVLVGHLPAKVVIAVPPRPVGRSSCRCGMREHHGGHHAGGLFLQDSGGFEHRSRGLKCPVGIYRNHVLAWMGLGINGDIALPLRYAGGEAGHGGSRVGDDGVRQAALHETAEERIQGERQLEVSGHVALVPAGRGEQADGSAVGNHENDIL